jgi:hypothetical protein
LEARRSSVASARSGRQAGCRYGGKRAPRPCFPREAGSTPLGLNGAGGPRTSAAAPGEYLFVAARASLPPAVLPAIARHGRYRPLAVSLLRVKEGSVVEVIESSRPALFEAFGLPMSFLPSRRPNVDEVNAKEVR